MPKLRSSKQENMEIDGTAVEIQKTEAAKKENIKAEVKVEPEDIKPGSSVEATRSQSQKSSDREDDSEDYANKPINTDRFFHRFLDVIGGLGSLIYDMKECEGTLLRNKNCTDPTCMPSRSKDPGCCRSCLGNDRYFYKVFLNEAYDILEEAEAGLGQFKG